MGKKRRLKRLHEEFVEHNRAQFKAGRPFTCEAPPEWSEADMQEVMESMKSRLEKAAVGERLLYVENKPLEVLRHITETLGLPLVDPSPATVKRFADRFNELVLCTSFTNACNFVAGRHYNDPYDDWDDEVYDAIAEQAAREVLSVSVN